MSLTGICVVFAVAAAAAEKGSRLHAKRDAWLISDSSACKQCMHASNACMQAVHACIHACVHCHTLYMQCMHACMHCPPQRCLAMLAFLLRHCLLLNNSLFVCTPLHACMHACIQQHTQGRMHACMQLACRGVRFLLPHR